MEESRGGRLLRNLEALQGDLALAESSKEQLEGVAQAAEQFISEQHRRMAQVGRVGAAGERSCSAAAGRGSGEAPLPCMCARSPAS